MAQPPICRDIFTGTMDAAVDLREDCFGAVNDKGVQVDVWISQTMNQIVGQWVALDLFIDFLQDSYLVKGLTATCILVMLMAAHTPDQQTRRNNVYATLMLVFLAIFIGRILQMVLPFSARPLYTEGMNLVSADGLGAHALENDSSFPSDHALMFLTMAASVLMYHRLAGIVLMLHAVFIICLPRIVMGFHWFSDIAVGAAIGIAIAVVLHRPVARWISASRLPTWQNTYPAVFYALLFAILCETATMYSGSRKIISSAAEFAHLVF